MNVPFSAGTRLMGGIYALVVISAMIFSLTSSDATSVVVAGIGAGLAWWIVDSPRKRGGKGRKIEKGEGGGNGGMGWLLRREGRGLPKTVLNLFVLGAAVYLLVEVTEAWGNQSLIIALAHFIIALQMSKLFEEKRPRDLVVLLVLTMLVAVSSAMFSTSSLLFAGLVMGYVALLAYCVMALHLGLEAHAAGLEGISSVLPEHGRERVMRTDLRRVARNCVLLVAPVAVVFFLVVPRTRGTAFVPNWNLGSYQTGFTDTVQFHDYGQLSQSDAVAMLVTLTRNGEELRRDANDLYFRGQVLKAYNASKAEWEPDYRIEPQDGAAPAVTAESVNETEGMIQEDYEIRIARPGGVRFLMGPVPEEFVPPEFVYSARDITLRYVGKGRSIRNYTVHSLPKGSWEAMGRKEPSFVPAGVLRAERVSTNPSGVQRVTPAVMVSREIMALARELAKEYIPEDGRPIPEEAIQPIMGLYESYLRKNYPYSLSFRQVDPALDPTTDFLVNRKQSGGHCEYFASAMVMLCRAVGLNARMVVGYHGGELNMFDKTYMVRERDAHAWAEVYVPGSGWVLSDPSPARGNNSGAEEMSLARWGNQMMQVIENYWLAMVVSFDNDSRQGLMAWVGERTQGVTQAVSLFFNALLKGSTVSDQLLKLSVLGPPVGLLLVVAWAMRRWRADRKRVRVIHGPQWRAMMTLSSGIGFLDDLVAMLERSGTVRRMDQTPGEFVEQFGGRLGAGLEEARWLIRTAYAVRYGGMEMKAESRNRVVMALRRVKALMRGKAT